jgi:mycothiol S-conjugate amidase
MRALPMTILAIFAHPDDEIGVGSTLAHYSDRGVFTALACASRGEAATIYCEDCATRENLADVRTHELECATRHLGVAVLRWLEWPDGAMQALPRTKAVEQVVALIRGIMPDVILTHPEHGLYPHPDHLAIWEIVREAFDAAGELGQYPGAGLPWSAARLFSRGIPQSIFDAAPEFGQYRVQLNGQQLPFYATPDAEIHVTMQVAASADRRTAAWDCHRSQHNPHGAFSRMPEEVRRAMAENEHFTLIASRVPLQEGVTGDLLAGVEDWAGEAGDERDPAGALRENLAARRAYMAVYEEYLRRNREPGLQTLLGSLRESEQDLLYLLAGALRRADEPASAVEPSRRLLAQALACENAWARRRFLRVGAGHAVALYHEKAAGAITADERALWEELRGLAEAQSAAIQASEGPGDR